MKRVKNVLRYLKLRYKKAGLIRRLRDKRIEDDIFGLLAPSGSTPSPEEMQRVLQ